MLCELYLHKKKNCHQGRFQGNELAASHRLHSMNQACKKPPEIGPWTNEAHLQSGKGGSPDHRAQFQVRGAGEV